MFVSNRGIYDMLLLQCIILKKSRLNQTITVHQTPFKWSISKCVMIAQLATPIIMTNSRAIITLEKATNI